MLIIDDNMYRLAKMQEKLLRVSNANRKDNLKQYKQTVSQIDSKAYAGLLEEIKHIDEHNHSLESELEFLGNIKNAYEQLLELQQNFKNLCEMYGEDELKLSDLSRLNIEYIDNRINAINGYLQNIKNIDTNKVKIQELSEELIDEEKKKIFLDKKILDLENSLRENFVNAEGRYVVDGKLIPTSVTLEYQKIGVDINKLLEDRELLDKQARKFEEEKKENTEKLRIAEICYNSMLNTESKQILEEIKKDELKTKYQVTLLKILKIVSNNLSSYKAVKEKREDLLELIKYRLSYIEQLGTHISIDPFSRIKIKEQLEIINSMKDNTNIINKIRKELSELNTWTEEMISQNNNYLILLSDTKKIIEDTISMKDMAETAIYLNKGKERRRKIEINQVVDIKNLPSTINMDRVIQKTRGVIKRVNQLVNSNKKIVKKDPVVLDPYLVIVPNSVKEPSKKIYEEINNDLFENHEENIDNKTEMLAASREETVINSNDVMNNLFESVTPFSEIPLFEEKNDLYQQPVTPFPDAKPSINQETPNITASTGVEMPQAFWPVQDTNSQITENNNNQTLSFDEQINILMAADNANKTLKKVS